MIKIYLKKFLKLESVERLVGKILYWYLKLVSLTSKIEIEFDEGIDNERLNCSASTVYAIWHQQLALAVIIFGPIGQKFKAVVSAHSDGKVLSKVIENTGCGIISGSTNKGAMAAAKNILCALREGDNIIITPDGPKGPAKEINSSITAICTKTSSFIVPVSIQASNYKELKSWDKFHFPLPFSKIKAKFGSPISPTGNKEVDDNNVKTTIENLAQENIVKSSNCKLGFETFLTIASILLLPFQLVHLLIRLLKKKESLERILERLSVASDIPLPDMIWIHAASVGETNVAFILIDIFLRKNRDLKFLLTTGTLTSANLFNKKIEQYNHLVNSPIIHQFLPIDNIFLSSQFVSYWKPRLAIFIESELWPNTLVAAGNACPLILVNGRMSERSFKRWHKFKYIINGIAARFDKILTQSELDKKHFEKLGFTNIIDAGNLKYIYKEDIINLDSSLRFTDQILDKKIIFAASTHPGEEKIIIEIYNNLKKKADNLLLIIAPRHPDRAGEIIEILESAKLNHASRSLNDNIMANTDVFLLDTIGEMNQIFKLKPITFMGGSFTIGGHNILEPAWYDCPIIYGPDMVNFQEISNEFLSKNAAIQVNTQEELEQKLYQMIMMPQNKLEEYTLVAKDIIKSKQQIETIYLQQIGSYLSEK